MKSLQRVISVWWTNIDIYNITMRVPIANKRLRPTRMRAENMKTNNRVLMYIVAMCLSFTACDTEGPDVLGVKDGAIVDGVFKVSANKSVRFSQGNLQYTQSTKTWSFAEHQYDILVEKNIVNAEYQGEENWKGTALADKIDLFGWSSDNSTTKGVSVFLTTQKIIGVLLLIGDKILF